MTENVIDRQWLRPGIACLWISNPSHRNAMNDSLIEQMISHVGELGRDPACRLIVVRGRGGIFSAGRELNDLRKLQSATLAEVTATYERLRVLNAAFLDCTVPTIAVIERFAFGAGATIVSWCDMALSEDGAFLCYPELQHGIVPSPAVMALLQSVPRKLALELLLSGRKVYGAEAARIGLITRSVPADQLDDALAEIIEGVRRCAPNATRRMLRFIVSADAMSVRDAMTEAVDSISIGLLEPDAKAGIGAFLEKRPAPWSQD
ncbi:MAG TPA: enoyl-CoA hydratase/isomerase family protein [Rhodopila sp.]